MTDYADCFNTNAEASELIKTRRENWKNITKAIDKSIETLDDFEGEKTAELALMAANKDLSPAWGAVNDSKNLLTTAFVGERNMLQALKDAAVAAELANS